MERKGNTAVVTAAAVKTGLKTATTSPAEEKALRMRYGAKVDLGAPLPTAHGDNEELGDELLLIEMRLLKALKQHQALAKGKATGVTVTKSPTKSKIVGALKKKS
jgi:hypothetical protein